MWLVVLLSVLAGLIRSAPAASLIIGCTVTLLLMDQANYWVPGAEVRELTLSGILWAVGKTFLAVLPAFAAGRYARHLLWRYKRKRDLRKEFLQ